MYKKFGQFIDGKWQPSEKNETYEVINPANEEIIGHASKATPADVNKALKSAEKGFEVWKKTPPWKRSSIIRKINDKVIKLWSKVLKKFPNTKIYFKAPELNNASIEKDLKNKFLNYGIKSDRLILEKSSDYKTYLESYLKVHISLDPFPWNGVTTSFESIWMGVPVFCLKGDDLPYSRCSYSINKNLKMNDWIANDENDYLAKLERILLNKKELLFIKKNLRERAIKNNLFNSKEFTKHLANTLNMVWKNFTIE